MQIRLQVTGTGPGPATLTVEAKDEAEAIRLASLRGLRVTAVAAAPPQAARAARREKFPLVLFTQELLGLLEAGITAAEALETLARKERRPGARGILEAVLVLLREGRRLSDALERYPGAFPELYVATVRSAERSGDLAAALGRYVSYARQFEAIRAKLVSTSVYPAMLLAVGAMATLFLLGYVVPKFSAVYESAGRSVPLASQVMLAAGRFIYGNWALVGGATALGTATVGYVLASRARRDTLFARLLRLPALAQRAAEFRLARLYRTLGLLLGSGIALPRAMTMCEGLFPAAEAARLREARRRVEEGMAFSQALEAEGFATPVAASLIRTGEKSGALADMLERAARFHDEDFARWLDLASRAAEPLLMAAIGVVIGGVVVLLYLPIFDLAGSLQ
jgi:general secretion pathway protein F